MSRPNNLITFYLNKIIKLENGCWILPFKTEKNGYLRIRCEGSRELAHRIFYRHYKGSFEPHLCIDHLCSNRKCVNPEHLEVVTIEENTRRSNAKRQFQRNELGRFQ